MIKYYLMIEFKNSRLISFLITILFLFLVPSSVLLAGLRLLFQSTPVSAVNDIEVSDYDYDGVGEVIAAGPDRRIYLYENNGELAYISNQISGTAFKQLLSIPPQLGGPDYGLLITDTQRALFNLSAKSTSPLWTNAVASGWVYVSQADSGDLNGDGLYDFANARFRSAANVFRVQVVRAVNGVQISETGNLIGNIDFLLLDNLGNSIYDSLIFSSNAPRLYIYNYNPSTGGLIQAASVALSQRYTFMAVISDTNGDGIRDIAAATYLTTGNNGIDIRSGTNGSLLAQLRVAGAGVPVSIASSDFDKDGFTEVVVGSGGTDLKVRVYKAGRSLSLLYQSPALSGNPFVRTSDFDYDGTPDIAVADGNNLRLIKYNPSTGQFNIVETSLAISGSIESFEKFKAKQLNGGQADDIVWVNSFNNQLKAVTFYTPPAKVLRVSNEKVLNADISSGKNYLIDNINFSANYDGTLNSIRYTYSGNLNPAYLTSLKIYLDDGNLRFESDKDTLLSQTTVQANQALFNLNLPFQSNAQKRLYLVADVRDDLPSGYNFKFSIQSPSDFYAQNFETTGTFPVETPMFITADRTIPVLFVQPSISSPNGNEGWYRSRVNIALSISKLGIIYYKWNDDTTYQVYNGQLSVPAGINTLHAYGVDLYGNKSTTKSVSFKLDITPPEAIRGIQAEQTDNSKVTVVWRPSLDKQPGSGVKYYEIYRDGKLLATVSSNQTTYEDLSIKPNARYRYKVRAVDEAGNKGSFSEEFVLTTKPQPVQISGLKVIEGERENIILWQPISSTEVAYIDIYRSIPRKAKYFSKINSVSIDPSDGIYIDELESERSGNLYYYKLKIFNARGEQIAESNAIKATQVSVETTVGSEGKLVQTASGRIKLEIPPGSLINETTLSIKSAVATYPANVKCISELYQFGPKGLSFSKSSTLSMSFMFNRSMDQDMIKIGHFDGDNWNFVSPDSIDTTNGIAKVKIDSFSIYGVFYLSSGIDTEPPKIEVVRGVSPSKIFVRFNEFIESTNVVNALIEVSETSVTTYYPFKDGKSIVVETKYMDPNLDYLIYISGIMDLAGNLIPEDGVSNVATFSVTPSPHGKYMDDTNKCSLCHSVHYGKNKRLLLKETATEVCYLCHDSNGSGSKYAIKKLFEDPETTSVHRTRLGDPGIYCTDCHSPHKDVADAPSLLRFPFNESTSTTVPTEYFCFKCHGSQQSTLPAHLVVKETSYLAGIHYNSLPGPPSGNGITCLQCHEPHASVIPTLMRGATEEYVCIICHKKNGVTPNGGISIDAPDVLSSLLNAPDATVGLPGFPADRVIWYKHPIIEYSGRHTLLELFDATIAAQSQSTTETRHAECEDCHNSHYAKKTIYRNPPYAPESILGAAGVKVLYPDQSTVPVFIWEPYGSITYEYEVCLRCHSSFSKAWHGDDLAKLFSPYNASYHPVISLGKNQTTAMANNLIGRTTTSTILCSDCHFSADITSPRGPHGSIYPFILASNYRFEIKQTTSTDDYNSKDFELCYRCHSEEPFQDASGASRPDTNFRFHGYHLRSLYNNPASNTVSGGILTPGAGSGNAICRECHYKPHGAINPRLVTFAPNVLPNGNRTEPVFVPKTQNSPGYCLLKCHGKNHDSGMTY